MPQAELQVESLKHETKAFNMECRNKIEDEMRERTEEVAASTCCGRSVSPTSEKLELTHPLYLLQQARSENNKRQLEVKRSTAVGPSWSSPHACDSLPFFNFNASRN